MPLRRNQRRGWEVLDPDTITGKVVAVALLLAVIVVADYAILLLISPPLESWETAHHITLSVISGWVSADLAPGMLGGVGWWIRKTI